MRLSRTEVEKMEEMPQRIMESRRSLIPLAFIEYFLYANHSSRSLEHSMNKVGKAPASWSLHLGETFRQQRAKQIQKVLDNDECYKENKMGKMIE